MKFSILTVLALSLSPSVAQAGRPGFVPQPTEPVTTSTEYLVVNSGVALSRYAMPGVPRNRARRRNNRGGKR